MEPISPFNDLINTNIISDQNLQHDLISNNKPINNAACDGFSLNNENSNATFLSNRNAKLGKNYNNITNDTSMVHTSIGMESDSGAITSDEERAAYADRRNGVGPRLVPALQNKKRTLAAVAAATSAAQKYQHQQQKQQNQKVTSSYSCNGLMTPLTSESAAVNLRNCGLDQLKNGITTLHLLFKIIVYIDRKNFRLFRAIKC